MITNKQVIELVKKKDLVRSAYDLELESYTRRNFTFPSDDFVIEELASTAFSKVTNQNISATILRSRITSVLSIEMFTIIS